MRRWRERLMTFTTDDVSLAMSLVASLDAARYKHPETKALILKCQAYKEGGYDGGRVV